MYATRKTTLKAGEFLVTADFSENYSFVLQNSAQGFHWNNSQATLHPFVAYYLDSADVRHLSYLVISDCLHHHTVAVHLFQKSFIDFLKTFLPPTLHCSCSSVSKKLHLFFEDLPPTLHPKRIIYFLMVLLHNTQFLSLCHQMILELPCYLPFAIYEKCTTIESLLLTKYALQLPSIA